LVVGFFPLRLLKIVVAWLLLPELELLLLVVELLLELLLLLELELLLLLVELLLLEVELSFTSNRRMAPPPQPNCIVTLSVPV